LPADERLVATGFDASLKTVLSGELARYRIVHFATHGCINSRYPALSSLVLSLVDRQGRKQDGFLRLADVYSLELDADLVVLSACRTALGKEVRGEGLIGLTRGFMHAGAARVLASLWSVDDRATAELMKRFYRHLLKDHLTPPAALRAAQLGMARDPRWASPYLWAGFSLEGEWR
jgi:CHAT domain-containing protein